MSKKIRWKQRFENFEKSFKKMEQAVYQNPEFWFKKSEVPWEPQQTARHESNRGDICCRSDSRNLDQPPSQTACQCPKKCRAEFSECYEL
jgi:hypothetical protein